MKRIMMALTAVILLAFFSVACGSQTKQEDQPLIIGMELAYPPFETKDDGGNPSGVSVDLAKALGEYVGRPVKIENLNWDGLIPSLQTGKVDLVISSMTITDERKEVVDFSIPYSRSYLALLVNKESGVERVEDLDQEDKVVDVKKGTIGAIYAKKHLTNATVNALTSENSAVTEVLQGKADAFIYDQLTVYRQHLENPELTHILQIPAQDSEDWGMVVKKGNTELLSKVDDFIRDFKAKDGFDQITEQYMAEEKQVFDELGFPWFFD